MVSNCSHTRTLPLRVCLVWRIQIDSKCCKRARVRLVLSGATVTVDALCEGPKGQMNQIGLVAQFKVSPALNHIRLDRSILGFDLLIYHTAQLAASVWQYAIKFH